MAHEISKVEEYVKQKGWRYQLNGNQIMVEDCPFCFKGDYKFFINRDNFLWDCKHGKCQRAGNEWTLKTGLGDKVENVISPTETGVIKQEKIPDVAKMHENLMENAALVNWLTDNRGWSVETIVKQKIGIANRYMRDLEREIPCWVYPYFSGVRCNFAKFRSIPSAEPTMVGYKGFASLQGYDPPLYNSNCIEKGMDYLILVEGEADAVSVLNLGENNVVGVPGAGMKKVTWDNLLKMPQKKYLLFDNDQPGQEGAKAFAERFGIDEFYNILLPEFDLIDPVQDGDEERTKGKDITEWVMAGGTLEDFKLMLRDAQPFDIEGVYSLDTSLARLGKTMQERGNNLPKYDTQWKELNRIMGGAEDKHLVILQAPRKRGKTSLAVNWADYLVEHKDVNCHIECLEMDEEQLARKWASFKRQVPDTPGRSQMTPEVVAEAMEIARHREHTLTFGSHNYNKIDEVFERLKTIIRRYGVKVIFFDNLQLLCDTIMGEKNANRPAFLSRLTKKFKMFAMEMNILVVLITQARSLKEDNIANADTSEGSSAAGNDCDTMIIMNRTKQVDVKTEDDLKKTVDYESTSAFDDTLYLEVGLSRFAPGGRCRLTIDGDTSTIRDESPEDEISRRAKETTGYIDGMKITPSAAKVAAMASAAEVPEL